MRNVKLSRQEINFPKRKDIARAPYLQFMASTQHCVWTIKVIAVIKSRNGKEI